MKILKKTFDLPLTQWIQDLKSDDVVVVDETGLLVRQEQFRSVIENKKLLVHCHDAVSPFFTEQHQDFINFLSQTCCNNKFAFVSVNHYPEFEKFDHYYYFPEYHAYYYPMYQNSRLDNNVIKKKFLSLNKREDPSRQLLYMKLYHDNLLADSYFSYLGENNNYQHLFLSESWDDNLQLLKKIIPEIQTWKIPVDRYVKLKNDQYLAHYLGINYGHGLYDPTWMADEVLYQTSFCSIICETGPTAHKPNFSEKTFRAIMQGHPMILIGAKNSVEALRNLGFDMYDDIFDHSYDTVTCPYTRQMLALKNIDSVANQSLDELKKIKQSLSQRQLNNIQNYQQLYNKMFQKQDQILKNIAQYVQS